MIMPSTSFFTSLKKATKNDKENLVNLVYLNLD